MGKKKSTGIQEGALIVFVAACLVLVVATLVIAFGEATVSSGVDVSDGFLARGNEQPAVTSTVAPSLTPVPTFDPRTPQPTLTF